MKIRAGSSFLLFALVAFSQVFASHGALEAQQSNEPAWKPPLASGGAPECPEHPGTRRLRSETIRSHGIEAWLSGTTTRGPNGRCNSTAQLHLSGRVDRTIPLQDAGKRSFQLVDFSAVGKYLLLVANVNSGYPTVDLRNVEVAKVLVASGTPQWINAWDVFRWGDCRATVEPQGFDEDGWIVLRVRPSTWVAHPGPDCLQTTELYRADLTGDLARLKDATTVQRFGEKVAEAEQPCKTDPDVIGACFTLRGKLTAWNGSPTLRIWRVGTKRILGVNDDEPLPADLQSHMNWDVEAWGDFTVCPFTRERPGVMQIVCIESSKQVVYKAR